MLSHAHLLTIRRATTDDHDALVDLAGLDSAKALRGEVLVAESANGPVAALEVESGRAVADPFRHTDPAVGMLRLRADQLRDRAPRARSRSRGFTRLAGAGR